MHAADEMCAKSPDSTSTAVDFIGALLATLELLSTSNGSDVDITKSTMSEDYVRKLNESYPSVSSADYQGDVKIDSKKKRTSAAISNLFGGFFQVH